MSIARALIRNPPKRLLAWPGRCDICSSLGRDGKTLFVEKGPWPRDDLLCVRCLSKPRERSLLRILNEVRPEWKSLDIHESSPGRRGASAALRQAPGYTSSQYFDDVERGTLVDGVRSEDLSQLTFADESFDVLITQDVLEHVLRPDETLSEIYRVLRPGGMHVATFPWYPQLPSTRTRARLGADGQIEHVLPEEYHRSPVNGGASLVTLDWGADLHAKAAAHGYDLEVHKVYQSRKHGIDGEFREVFVFTRPA
jgi:SAM-dependent methyltransferase